MCKQCVSMITWDTANGCENFVASLIANNFTCFEDLLLGYLPCKIRKKCTLMSHEFKG